MSDPIGRWTEAAMPRPTIPPRRPTPSGPIVLPGQAPPAGPSRFRPSGSAVAASERRTRGLATGPRARYARAYIPQQQQPSFFMPSVEEQGAAYRIGAGIDPRAQAVQPPGIMDWIKAAMDIKAAADKREQDRLNWEYKELQDQRDWDVANREFAELLRQFQVTSGGLADWRQGQLGQQQADLAQRYAQMQQTGAYNQASLAQRWAQTEMERQAAAAQLGQRRREMGADIGQGIAGMQSQQWAQGMPYALPSGTMFAPGMGPGGPVSEMARRSGVSYTPPRLAKTPPPSSAQMEAWISDAIAKFGQ